MRNQLLTLLCLLLAAQAFAQIHTRSQNRAWDMHHKEKILILPFEPRMIISDIHGDMCRVNSMDSQELRERLQEAIMASFPSSVDDFEFVLAGMTGEDPPKELFDVYRLVRYAYTQAPPLPQEEGRTELIHRLLPDEPNQTKRGVVVQNGELNRFYDGKERFMDPTLDETLVKALLEAFHCDRLCFLTEFDVRLEDPTRKYTGDPSAKILKLHFAWYNAEGEKRFAGLLQTQIAETNYELHEFSSLHFPVLCAQTIATLPDWPVEEKPVRKKKDDEDY